MELVIDANIIFSALIKDSYTRYFLLFSNHSFCVPEFVFEEINKHILEIKEKTGLSQPEIKEILFNILTHSKINIIPFEEFQNLKDQAAGISPDPDDIHYVALALKQKCAIWSNDKKLKEKQKQITVYTSEEIFQFEASK
ncbi:hypothetical protein COV18_05030 [Candidatus Woesearchaeota archaeon CG10_big_fil_rev_8_21_14_0_10_37_12]|nr:MAG: hypothetical protein COV18_05030 [Candidatus Woesearchaeota archaeon CG10_big_fil_rev_8_21_14_0_10_37_12]